MFLAGAHCLSLVDVCISFFSRGASAGVVGQQHPSVWTTRLTFLAFAKMSQFAMKFGADVHGALKRKSHNFPLVSPSGPILLTNTLLYDQIYVLYNNLTVAI